MQYRLRLSIPPVVDDLAFFPDHFLQSRRGQFLTRGVVAALLVLTVLAPALASRLLWMDSTASLGDLWLRSSEGLARVWTSPGMRTGYQPLSDTILWIQHYLWESKPAGYHFVSLLLHTVNVLLVWFACRRLSVPGAWLVAVAFGIHPAQVQAVTWLGSQAQVAATTFYLASVLTYLRFAQVVPPESDTSDVESPQANMDGSTSLSHYHRDGGPFNYLMSLAFFVAAILAGTWTWTLPAVLALLLWWRLGRKDLLALLPFIAVGLAACVFHFWWAEVFATRHGVAEELSLPERVLIWGRSFWFYLLQLAAPYELLFVYTRWRVDALQWWQHLFPVATAMVLGAAWYWRTALSRGPTVAILFYATVLLPTAGLVRYDWMRHSFVGDHLAYLARLGLIALVVAALTRLADRTTNIDIRRLRRALAGIAVLTVLGIITFNHAQTYADAPTLWRHVLAHNPTSVVANRGLAATFLAQGHPDLAVKHLRSAMSGSSNDVDLAVDLGIALEADGRLDEAEKELLWATRLDPNHDQALRHLASIASRQGKHLEALRYIEMALRLNPRDAIAHGQRGAVYRRQNQLDAAIHELRTALELDPAMISARLELSDALFQAGKLPESAEQLQQIVRFDPRNFDAYMKAGDMLGRLNDFPLAERMFRSAVRIRPTAPEAHNNLGAALAAQGRMSEAIYCFGQAVRLKPDFGSAQRNLVWATARRETDSQHQPASAPTIDKSEDRRDSTDRNSPELGDEVSPN